MKKNILLFVFISVFITGCQSVCSKDLIESVTSPDEKYTIKTYLINCGATVDWSVKADLCDENDECKQIYNCYHENASSVYWIDDETVFINNKTLNIHKDKYDWRRDDDYYDKIYKKYGIS